MQTDKLEALVDEALDKGRKIERERCLMLCRLAQEEAVIRGLTPTEAIASLMNRVENPKA